jgi:hypothetical protein
VGLGFALLFGALAITAALDEAWSIYTLLGGVALWILARTIHECGSASAAFLAVVKSIKRIGKKDLPWAGKNGSRRSGSAAGAALAKPRVSAAIAALGARRAAVMGETPARLPGRLQME